LILPYKQSIHPSSQGEWGIKKYSLILLCLLFCLSSADAKKKVKKVKKATPVSQYYGIGLCNKVDYKCVRVKRGQSWKRMFPNATERDLVQRLNRTDTYLYRGRRIAIPVDMKSISLTSISPFPLTIKKPNEKLIIINQNLLAWGAYNPDGHLVKWGPISSGKDYCPDVRRNCRTIVGIYYVFNRKGYKCRSNIYPVGRGGSHMPYCMFFYKGYALHGSKEVRGFRDSHGCVRLFIRDAKWLNEHFVNVIEKRGDMGTKIVVQKLKDNK